MGGRGIGGPTGGRDGGPDSGCRRQAAQPCDRERTQSGRRWAERLLVLPIAGRRAGTGHGDADRGVRIEPPRRLRTARCRPRTLGECHQLPPPPAPRLATRPVGRLWAR